MKRIPPYVEVVCVCHEDNTHRETFSTSAIDDIDDRPVVSASNLPASLQDPFSRFPLSELYFCEHCHSLRCHRCVDEEIIARYCPQCLFEVTPSAARKEGNRCQRNCFQCPLCLSGAYVIKNGEETKEKDAIIKCPFCEWSCVKHKKGLTESETRFKEMKDFYFEQSLEEGLTLAAMRKNESTGEFVEQGHRRRQSESTTFAEILEKRVKSKQKKEQKTEMFYDIQELDEGLDHSLALLQAACDEDITGFYNSTSNDADHPLQYRLRAKTVKKCRACHHTLVKPDPKPSSIKFKIRLLAMNYLPSLRISFPPIPPLTTPPDSVPLVAGSQQLVYLTITNPLQVPIKMNISTPATTCTIMTPSFHLGAASESWDEMSLVSSTPSQFLFRTTKYTKLAEFEGRRKHAPEEGILQSGSNWSVLMLEIQPELQRGDDMYEIPLFVSYEFKVPGGDSDNSDEETISIGYWNVLTVGQVFPKNEESL